MNRTIEPSILKLVRRTEVNENGCWVWQGATSHRGYGTCSRYVDGEWKQVAVHRLSYEMFSGRDPGLLFVCHRCDNPPCCNPMHLFLGTAKDNTQDCIRKGRFGKQSEATVQHGHALTSAGLYETGSK